MDGAHTHGHGPTGLGELVAARRSVSSWLPMSWPAC